MNRRDFLEASCGPVLNPDRIDKFNIAPYHVRVLACYASPLPLSEFNLIPGAAFNCATEFLRGSGYLEKDGPTIRGWRLLGGIE